MEWISVEEEVPKETGRYWCYVKGVGCLSFFYQQDNCAYNAVENRWSCEAWSGRNEMVTHWMHLPEAPNK